MQKAVWNGLGEGSSVDPFILEVDNSFDINNSFNIKIENNFMGWHNEENYFKFSNSTTVYLLALIIKDRNDSKYFMTKNAIDYTFIASNHMNINEGPFTVTSYLGVYYLLKQQVFNQAELIYGEVILEVIRVEQKLDTHIEDVDNPHGVTAEQVDTYVKTTIDNKDAATLQAAKGYTYSQVEIDNKDTAVLTEAKDYTYSQVEIDNKDTVTLQAAKGYTYSQVEIDNKDTIIMNKANNLENANMLKDVVYNNVNGILTFTKYDNTTKEIDLPLERLVKSGYYDEVANEIVLVLENSSEIRVPVSDLLTDLDAHNIRFNGSGTNYLTAETEVEGAIKELDTKLYQVETLVGDSYTKAEVVSLLSMLGERIDRLEEALNWSVNLLELIDSLCWTDTCTSALETDLTDALCWTGTCENASSSNLVFSLQWT